MLLLGATGLDAAALIEVMFIVWLASVSGGFVALRRTAKRIIASVPRLATFGPRNRARAPRRRKLQRKSDTKDEPDLAFA